MSNFSQSINYSIPKITEAEVSLFGAGVGEAIVLHYNGGYYIVDSCRDPFTKRPAALQYLENMGVDTAENVKGIIISHWHTDHIKGMAEIVTECPKAPIWFSDALIQKEALHLAVLFEGNHIFSKTEDHITEFVKVIHSLKKQGVNRFQSISNRTTIYDSRKNTSRLVALSPSGAAIKQSIQQLLKTSKIKSQKLVVKQSSNLNAVALYFECNGIGVLLGSDLEDCSDDSTGWKAVINSDTFVELELEKSKIYKVPHHGSANGFNKDLINEYLEDDVISIITPYTPSDLPREMDIARTISHSSKVFVTNDVESKEKRSKKVEQILSAATKSRTKTESDLGHIQIRWSEEDINVGLSSTVIEHL